jgi:nucleoside 2-deoxyribosyltransferase
MKFLSRIYLAGPDVFLPNAQEIAKKKQEICRDYGFIGVCPDELTTLPNYNDVVKALAIYQNNIKLMDSCDLIVANMTPFRGVSMDVGTSFELGYMAAKNKPLFGYSNDHRLYCDRSLADGMTIESFGFHDNLMLEGAILTNGGYFLKSEDEGAINLKNYYGSLDVFEKLIKLIARG